MPLSVVNQDILTMKVDAIVNSTNHHMKGFSGVDQLLHEVGGEEFEKECRALRDKCVPGEAVYTNAYIPGVKYIIHTVARNYHGGIEGEAAVLRSCYKKSLELATELGCASVAFPLISAGSLGYPIQDALQEAITSISEYLKLYDRELKVYLVIYGDAATKMAKPLFGDLDSYIQKTIDLDDMVYKQEGTFAEKLNKIMKKKHLKASQVYQKNINRAAFHKIQNGKCKPSLETAVAIIFGLQLDYDSAINLLGSAGMTLSNSRKYDIIVSYFLKTQNYNVADFNKTLYEYGYRSSFIGAC